MTTVDNTPIEVFDFYAITDYLQGLKSVNDELMKTPLLAILPKLPPSAGDEAKWYEQEAGIQDTTTSATISSAQTSVVETTLFARVGDIIQMDSEKIRVTAVAPSTKTLTITRAYDGTSAAIHSAGTTMKTVGNTQVGGATFTEDQSVRETEKTNYFQITTTSWKVTGSSKSTNAVFGGATREREIKKCRLRHFAKIEKALIYNESAVKQAASTPGIAKGLAGFITTNSYDVYDANIGGTGTATDTNITWDKLNDFAGKMHNAGASGYAILMCGVTAMAAVREAMEADGTSTELKTGKMGDYGTVFTGGNFRNGTTFILIENRQMPTGDLYYLDAGNPENSGLAFVPKEGRDLKIVPKAQTGDFEGEDWISEFSFILMNEKCHGRVKSIAGGA